MKHLYSSWLWAVFLTLACISPAWAQTKAIHGVVKSLADGVPVMGASVIIKGTSQGTTTDKDGQYQINASPEQTLVFSGLGFKTKEILVGDQTTLDVTLEESTETLTAVEIVGSRSLSRTATETPVAVDVIPMREVTQSVGQMDINQVLQYVAPSFNSNRQSGADGSDHIDPATLRGLGPDQTLVLINGKRRHQSSLINLYGTRGRGNTGTDLNTIPTAAIDRIEILRDGAAAQYGSDAIAGVINIVLKSDVDKFSGNLNTGIYGKGDGQNIQINGNYGFRVGEKGGFVNVTGDFLSRGHTNRAPSASETVYRRQFGDAASDNFTSFFNARLPINDQAEFYAFGGYSYRWTDAYAWTREADSDRNIKEIYPNGFDPRIQSAIVDKSLSTGIKGKLKGWTVDFNNTFGGNKFHFFVDETLNASMLTASPTRFDAGGYEFSQNTTGLNFTRYFEETLKGVNVAFGVEHRIDNYRIFAGEEASWRNFGVRDTLINGRVTMYDFLGKAGGSQGFPGFRPSNVLNEYRSNLGAYFDVEADIVKGWTLTGAVRFERYSDFGNTFNGKLATRYAFSDKVALRASVSTGFRAPSLAQVYFNSTFTDFVSGQPVDKIIAGNHSTITRVLGIPRLKQETALNASFGVTSTLFDGFTLTVDGYYVQVKDRIVLTGAFDDQDDAVGKDLQTLGVGGAQFFTNAVDTKTTGVDIIAVYDRQVGEGKLTASLAANLNKIEIESIKTTDKLKNKEDVYFGKREQLFLLASAPPSKYNLTLNYKIKRFNANVRVVRFGQIELEDWTGERDVYTPRATVDLALGYDISEHVSLTFGGTNILDELPTKQNNETESGGNYDAVQMGFNGRFFFSKLRFKF